MAEFGEVLLLFKREPDGNSSMLILHNLSYKAFCCLCLLIYLCATVGWDDAVAGASAVMPFSAEDDVPAVSSVV